MGVFGRDIVRKKMYKKCELCNKKKPHRHKGCNEDGSLRVLVKPQKKKNVNKSKYM